MRKCLILLDKFYYINLYYIQKYYVFDLSVHLIGKSLKKNFRQKNFIALPGKSRNKNA